MPEIIEVLKQKNYLIECYNTPKLSNLIRIVDFIKNLKKMNILSVDDNSINIINNSIENYFTEELLIVFKKKYIFPNMPTNYKYIQGQMICFISPVDLKSKFIYKSLKKLEIEVQNNINALYNWAIEL